MRWHFILFFGEKGGILLLVYYFEFKKWASLETLMFSFVHTTQKKKKNTWIKDHHFFNGPKPIMNEGHPKTHCETQGLTIVRKPIKRCKYRQYWTKAHNVGHDPWEIIKRWHVFVVK